MKTTTAGLIGMAMICMGFSGQPKIECDITVRGQDSVLLKDVKILVVGSSANAYTDVNGKATVSCAVGDVLIAAVKSSKMEIVMEKDTPKSKAKKSRKK